MKKALARGPFFDTFMLGNASAGAHGKATAVELKVFQQRNRVQENYQLLRRSTASK